MHGANEYLPVTCIENISLPTQRAFCSGLGDFATRLDSEDYSGPLLILVGIDSVVDKAMSASAPMVQLGVAHG
jgi:siroheme synthase